MDENYSLRELNEWADKVIDCISKWADEMNKAFNGAPTSIKIEKLDSSAHDKVFEDKIEELDRMRKTWIDNAVKWQRENEKLKKQIAELESKEDEKPTKYITVIVAKEINGQEYVRLEDFMSVVNDLQAEIGT